MADEILSLGKLKKIYNYKKLVAQREYEEQLRVVEKYAAELFEIVVSVSKLESTLQTNSAYMRQEEVGSDARKMVFALKYKAQIEYDHERESFFMGLAQADLEAQQLELKRRQAVIVKFDAKIDAVEKKIKKTNHARAALEELSQEEDFEQIYTVMLRQNV